MTVEPLTDPVFELFIHVETRPYPRALQTFSLQLFQTIKIRSAREYDEWHSVA